MGMRILSTLQTGRTGRPEDYRCDRSGRFELWWFGLALSLSTFCSFAQLDTEHLIPLVWSSHEPGGITVYLNLSTPSPTPFQVTVVNGNGALLASPTISKGNSATVNLGNARNAATANAFAMGDGGLGVTSEGLIARADQPFYANYRAFEAAQAISVSASNAPHPTGFPDEA